MWEAGRVSLTRKVPRASVRPTVQTWSLPAGPCPAEATLRDGAPSWDRPPLLLLCGVTQVPFLG